MQSAERNQSFDFTDPSAVQAIAQAVVPVVVRALKSQFSACKSTPLAQSTWDPTQHAPFINCPIQQVVLPDMSQLPSKSASKNLGGVWSRKRKQSVGEPETLERAAYLNDFYSLYRDGLLSEASTVGEHEKSRLDMAVF